VHDLDAGHDLEVLHDTHEDGRRAERAGDLAVVRDVEGLSDLELSVLAVERRRYRHQGAKEQAVRDELDLSATRYYQVLNALLDHPAALAHDPVLVGRLRRLRDARTAGSLD
jgi:hypothetical protein